MSDTNQYITNTQVDRILDAPASSRELLKLTSQAAVRQWLSVLTEDEIGDLLDEIDLSTLVPYTGATGAVDLGSNSLTCGAITASGAITATAGINIANTIGNSVTHSMHAAATTFFRNFGNSMPMYSYGTVDSGWGTSLSSHGYTVNLCATGTTKRGFWLETGGNGGYGDVGLYRLAANSAAIGNRNGVLGALTCNALTCGAITATGATFQTGLTPTAVDIFGTYTSGTSFERLRIGYSSADSGYLISQEIGSAGGTAQLIKIGHRDAAGTFKAGVSFAANGNMTLGNRIFGTFAHFNVIINTADTRSLIEDASTGIILCRNNANALLQIAGTSASFPAIKRNAAAINLRLADDSADAALTCGDLTASGTATIIPPTTDPGIAGALWNDGGTLAISAG